jgi:hypothetical protein
MSPWLLIRNGNRYIPIFKIHKYISKQISSWKRLKMVDRKLYKECKCKEKIVKILGAGIHVNL